MESLILLCAIPIIIIGFSIEIKLKKSNEQNEEIIDLLKKLNTKI